MADLVGTLLDHFRIVELLGVGGMGAVYKARDFDCSTRMVANSVAKALTPHPPSG